MRYGLDEKMGFVPMLLYGIQWWVVSIPAAIILGIVVANIHGLGVEAQMLYMQKIFILMGLTTIVQVLIGHRLPLVIGPASTLLVGIATATGSSFEAIYTAIIIGGAGLSLLAYSGVLDRVHSIFTPRVVAVILILIALALAPVILGLLVKGTPYAFFNLFFALIMVFALITLNKGLKGLAKSTTLLWGIILGSIIYKLMLGISLVPDFPKSQWAGNIFLSHLEFDLGTIISFFFCFIALIINELGSIESTGQMLKAEHMPKRNRKGIGVLGISNMLCGAFGVIGFVDFSMSTGVISSTRCASRYTLIPSGILLILCALIPGSMGIILSIPGAVMGALLFYVLSAQLSAGLQMLVGAKAVHDFSSGVIVGIPLMIALVISNAPPETFAAGGELLRPLLSNGFVMGLIAVLLLEHCIFKDTE